MAMAWPTLDAVPGLPDAAPSSAAWQPPIRPEDYDRCPTLTVAETEAIARVAALGTEGRPYEAHTELGRLLRPLYDLAAYAGTWYAARTAAPHVLVREMDRRGTSYWAWTTDEWCATLTPTQRAFWARHGRAHESGRQALLTLAYLCCGFQAFERFPLRGLNLHATACHVFGRETVEAAMARVVAVAEGWGYTANVRHRLRTATAEALLANRHPCLDALTYDVVATRQAVARRSATSCYDRAHGLWLLSRVLVSLGVLDRAVASKHRSLPVTQRLVLDDVAPEWVAWCVAWHERAVLARQTKDQTFGRLLHVGRWLAACHPEVTSPEQWDHDLAADFIAAVDRWRVGEWSRDVHYHGPPGKPFSPRAKDSLIACMRRFLLDLQELPHAVPGEAVARTIARRFNPQRVLQTPAAIKNLIGPDPRVIDTASWLKILHAAETLTAADLPLKANGGTSYPLELVRAIAAVWCYAGRRADEIRRLRVGCVRWQWTDDLAPAPGEAVPADAVCFLRIPVNKTNTAFTTAVAAVVGRRIEEWERVRPAQPPALDPKTNEMVDFLFSYRSQRLSANYLNAVLIPLLCAKAGIPRADARGPISCHRARATLATLLYNAPEGLTLNELKEWLGHKNVASTIHYTRIEPTRLAKAVARANKNSRLVEVLVDTDAAARGEPALFYYLGNGSYCANPAWASCPHRMACILCPMHVSQGVATEIEARAGIVHMLAEIPLTDEERAVADGDVARLDALIARKQGQPAPTVPDARYVFNRHPGDRVARRGTPVPVIQR